MDWKGLEERNAWIFHLDTGVVGKVVKYYDGETDKYFPDDDVEAPLTAPVLRLHQGHVLVCGPDKFLELTTKEVSFYIHALAAQETLLLDLAKLGGNERLPPGRGIMLVRSALSAQLAALSVGATQ